MFCKTDSRRPIVKSKDIYRLRKGSTNTTTFTSR